ncbi:probable long-chain-alcohol O-fatty-acyltransferase 5 [Diospyros lotus]|uniref:probable long-chain-alcohol O-fatty-acyltransferase 5 n=1 Tax=Diospyros lotus TaxID=55363 RepID=UPI002251289A|nr:probable long-chain-alcohol O-fatty-acyltransferase 5 [Diospyros lotus]
MENSSAFWSTLNRSMEEEMMNFVLVSLSVVSSLFYCSAIAGKFVPHGTARFLAVCPVICLFLYLPLFLNTVSLGATISFMISWLANFRLLLFAFGRGPLSSPLSFPNFVLVAILPIKVRVRTNSGLKTHKSPLNYAAKAALEAVVIYLLSRYRSLLHPKLVTSLYCFHIYISLEFWLAIMAALARALARLEIDPGFDEPYLASSLQDFWGRRWNLIVASTLRPAVYDPVRRVAATWMGREWASMAAVVATFSVSGLMHELILYHVERRKPTWEMTGFFLLHEVCLGLEIRVKKALNIGKFGLPWMVSGPMVILFVVFTGSCLFFPPIVRCETDIRTGRETAAVLDFVKHLTYLD